VTGTPHSEPTPRASPRIASLANPRVKRAVKLRRRSHRDELNLMLIEGYRELKRALEAGHPLEELFVCEELFQGANEPELVARCAGAGAAVTRCTAPVFRKMAYRDRPEGLLALAPPVRRGLADLNVPAEGALLVIAEAVEKPGNLGTILRSADAAGAHAVVVCDRCTDVNNPNVVRASIGTLFTVPVAEAASDATLRWLRERGIRIVGASPHAGRDYTDADMTGGTAIVVGAEQYGLTATWLEGADCAVRIPMRGRADSLNVAAAATILLFEAVRQRREAARNRRTRP